MSISSYIFSTKNVSLHDDYSTDYYSSDDDDDEAEETIQRSRKQKAFEHKIALKRYVTKVHL